MSDEASAKAKQYLEEMGVKVHLNCAMKSYDGYEITFGNGEKLISRILLWAAGVKGNPIDGLNPEVVTRGGRVFVEFWHRIKGYPDIFAIGDLAQMEDLDIPKVISNGSSGDAARKACGPKYHAPDERATHETLCLQTQRKHGHGWKKQGRCRYETLQNPGLLCLVHMDVCTPDFDYRIQE